MDSSTYEQEHINILRGIAPECMVLLKSDGSFPLAMACEIALYGSGARKTIKGGSGSGNVHVRHFTTVEEGLERAGFTITTKEWLDGYDVVWELARKAADAQIRPLLSAQSLSAVMMGIGAAMSEPDYELPLTGAGDTAVYVLSHVSGEGNDRCAVPGDFALTRTETRDILQLQRQYARFMLVLNVGGVVDLSPVVEAVPNILLLSQTGMTVGDSFADVLLGKSYPSGRLASTWAKWEDYCHIGEFGNEGDVRYREGIYVGYRWFDSAGKAPIFPFGHGLSYTQFARSKADIRLDGADVTVEVTVKNIGDRPGKEVVQLYVSIPEGKLNQPDQTLAAFVKSDELAPGQSQKLTMRFPMESLASFDEDSASAILEQGDYVLRVGTSSRDTEVCAVIRLERDAVVQRLSRSGGRPDFQDWKPETRRPDTPLEGVPVCRLEAGVIREARPAAPVIDSAAKALAAQMTDEELACFCVGGFRGEGSQSIIGNAGIQVAGSAGETTGKFVQQGIPGLVMADGPAGLRLSRVCGVDEQGVYSVDEQEARAALRARFPDALDWGTETPHHGKRYEQNCSALPVGTALAQSWNVELCEQCGDLVGAEMERFGVQIWLAPALNIHRSPLCGRNFEYYSEDPLISGKMAAAATRGIQRHPGRTVTVKHFACNNQENDRFHSNSVVSQRALRDIYLRGFYIAVTEGTPLCVMSSYNLLNGEHTSQREDLLETILRQEWGYEGIVMSDWVAADSPHTRGVHQYPSACAPASIRAGNDIMMPGGPIDHKNLLDSLHDPLARYPLTRASLEKCAARIIALALRLARM